MLTGKGNRGGSVVPALLGLSIVLFVCMIGAYAFKPGEPAPERDASRSAETLADLLDPAPYRASIVSLESVLYRASPSDFGTADRVSGLAQRLAIDVRGSGTDRRRHTAYGELFDWAGRVDSRAGAGYATTDLAQLRREWESVRGRVFLPAVWFEASSVQRTESQSRPSENVDPTVVRRLEVSADRITTMIRRGRRRAMSLPEASVDAELNSQGARTASQRWNDFARSWSASVDEMGGELPEHPGGSADSNVLMAHQELGRALDELRNVTWSAASTTNIPFKYERENHFDSAESRVETARQHLGKLSESESY